MHPKTVLKTADGKAMLGLPEGTVVTKRAVRAATVEVVLPDGRSGWLAQHDIAAVN